jgi:hypothetical protein
MSQKQKNTKLLVPIYLEALAVTKPMTASNSGRTWADLSPNFSSFRRRNVPKLGIQFAPVPFQKGATPPDMGVHLHWALPAELTHGVQHLGEAMQFPTVPNRWFVLRIPTDAPDDRARAKAWVLESDYLGRDGTNTFLTYDPKSEAFSYLRLGKAFAYGDGPKENQNYLQQLTAIGPGNPLFAAFYPGCRNVFGFHDDLAGIDAGTFSYLVAGWYAQDEDDPLNPADKWQRLKELKSKWNVVDLADDEYPTETLCHGTVHSLQWDRNTAPLGGVPEAEINIAVGNSAVEALSALIGERSEAGRMVETLLSAFQYDMFSNPRELPDIAEIDLEVHRRGFYPDGGGTEWVIQKAERQPLPSHDQDQQVKPFPIPGQIAADFDRLNMLQRKQNRLRRELASLQWEYYAAWFKSKLTQPAALNIDFSPEMMKINDEIKEINQQVENTQEELELLEQKIKEAEDFRDDKPDYELIEKEMPRFWRPNNPAILLAGPGIQPSDKYARTDNPEKLKCRIPEQLLTAMIFSVQGNALVPAADGPYRVGTESMEKRWAFPLDLKSGGTCPYSEIKALFYEALLLDPGLKAEIAWEAYAQYGRTQAKTSQPVIDLAEKIAETQKDFSGENEQKYIGRLPAEFAVRSWRQAWSPLFMIWETQWAPAYENPADFHPVEHWEFLDNRDYKCKAQKFPTPSEYKYNGWVPLSLNISRNLQESLQNAPQDIAERFGSWKLLTQSLNGLSKALIMREKIMQMPPLREDGTIEREVADIIGDAKDSSPLTLKEGYPFCPIRAGYIKLRRLWIVDTFGQVQQVMNEDDGIMPRIIVSDNLAGLVKGQEPWIPLPPRILQPARLLFRWLSAADEQKGQFRETNSNPATSPVCGWIVPNHLDKSLIVFNARGIVQGVLQATGEGESQWSDEPGSDRASGAEPALPDPHLQSFIKNLQSAGSKALAGLLTLIDRISLCITTGAIQQVRDLSVLVGQPLAVVRATLQLELAGRPVTDQSWSESTTSNSRGFTAVKFPVRLGDIRMGRDGLIGYFVEKDYRQMRPARGFSQKARQQHVKDADGYLNFDDHLLLSADGVSTNVTLLMDPRADVQASSGILPVQFLGLPPQNLADALENMELLFRVGPFIGTTEHLRIPLPEDVRGKWSCYFYDHGKWRLDEEIGKKENIPEVAPQPLQVYEGWLKLSDIPGAS